MFSILAKINWTNHRVVSLVAAVVLPFVLYTMALPEPIFRFLLPVFILLVGAVELITWRTLSSLGGDLAWVLVRSSLFYLSWGLLFFLVPSASLQTLYIFSSIPILYVGQQLVAYTGETVLITHTILTSFGITMGVVAGEYYFHASGLILSSLLFVVYFLLARATYVFVPQTSLVRFVASILVALCAVETYIAILYLPFHYTVVGFLAFLTFYLFWLLTYYWQFGVLTFARVKFYLLISLLFAGGLLLATPWRVLP